MTVVADRLADLLAHRKTGDPENDAIVDAFVLALADTLDRLGLVAFGDPDAGVPGDRVLTDPAYAPLWALAHAALYVGARLPGRFAGESDAAYLARARDATVYPLGIKRGTHEAVRRQIQPFLTGSKTVFISDNYGGLYDIFVRTLVAETPDPAVVREHLEGGFVSGSTPGAIRAELRLTYVAADYVAWAEATRTWAAVPAGVTWANATREDLT